MALHIELLELAGLGVIIACKSGVVYTNQTGGTSCLSPEIEGAFVPLRNDTALGDYRLISPANDLFEYFSGEPHSGTGATSGLTHKDADFIDGLLEKHSLSSSMVVDRMNLASSHEAWVHVNIIRNDPTVFMGLDPLPASGILTWENTD